MRILVGVILGWFGGFILGIAFSSIIGIVTLTLFDIPMGIKFLSYFTAFIGAVLVPVLDRRRGE
ncbi:DUF5957 family protein [Gracilibacillus alcaliphilus]|uniref:DUF5957 family protein n=1 Tax=Gracilibacillus alcaliphilus TaxID=1401441 RepID=UPI00195CD69E|nr:DUF5957 family protein [Gracilibacillus alcaliphilus]MBM7676325.1 putative membrane protein YeaQ/YmgE (transglycosylase-associated protein family) [Gracilibacillus alcaliphilus]